MHCGQCPGAPTSERYENMVGFSLYDADASKSTPTGKFVLVFVIGLVNINDYST